jgi:hypothetical protein
MDSKQAVESNRRISMESRKVVEKRIEIFDKLSPDLNKLYCFFMWIGDWRETTPEEAIAIKRRLDKGFYVNRFIIGEEAFHEYQRFIHLTFLAFVGPGKDALLLTSVVGPGGDRRANRHFSWKDEWDDLFSPKDAPERNGIHEAYNRMMHQFSRSIGL